MHDSRTTTRPRRRFDDADIDRANMNLDGAFTALNLTADRAYVCPRCGTNKPKKVVFRTAATSGRPYWKCFACGEHGSAVKLLTDDANMTFPDAVALLLGEHTGAEPGRSFTPPARLPETFRATVDRVVYNTIRNSGSPEAAASYYRRWHIDRDVTVDAGSTVLLDPAGLQQLLLERFGAERLRSCGVVTEGRDGSDVFLFGDEYCVVEPHEDPDGQVVGLQFRPSPAQRVRVDAHKAWKARWSGRTAPDGTPLEPSEVWAAAYAADPDTAGDKCGYVTPFLSLKGGTPEHLVGCGLRRLAAIDPGARVYVVEGFKDLLAARTLGVEAYALPGTGVMPPEVAVEVLARHQVVVAMDGDAAGDKGRDAVIGHLSRFGVEASSLKLPGGFDMADVCVDRAARSGCDCEVCQAHRARHH
jgi:hypothetical protein